VYGGFGGAWVDGMGCKTDGETGAGGFRLHQWFGVRQPRFRLPFRVSSATKRHTKTPPRPAKPSHSPSSAPRSIARQTPAPVRAARWGDRFCKMPSSDSVIRLAAAAKASSGSVVAAPDVNNTTFCNSVSSLNTSVFCAPHHAK